MNRYRGFTLIELLVVISIIALLMDGEFLWSYGGGLRRVCTNRHHGGVNMLFMDWSTSKVGLQKLWTLKWHRTFDTAGPWTPAGGVVNDDWPRGMKNL